jgi:hypothetical protein
MRVSLRQAVDADYEFVKRIYFETQRWITEELFGWRGDEAEAAKFLESYHAGRSSIIVVENVDVGWLAVDRDRDHIELKDIYITAETQNRGIGIQLYCFLHPEYQIIISTYHASRNYRNVIVRHACSIKDKSQLRI